MEGLVRIALRVTALMNLVGGTVNLLLPSLHERLFGLPEGSLSGLTLRLHLIVWLFVVAMGLGYAVASRDPRRHTALILSGGVGKLMAAALWVEMFLSGLGGPMLLAGVAFDAPLGLLFLAFLAVQARGTASPP